MRMVVAEINVSCGQCECVMNLEWTTSITYGRALIVIDVDLFAIHPISMWCTMSFVVRPFGSIQKLTNTLPPFNHGRCWK